MQQREFDKQLSEEYEFGVAYHDLEEDVMAYMSEGKVGISSSGAHLIRKYDLVSAFDNYNSSNWADMAIGDSILSAYFGTENWQEMYAAIDDLPYSSENDVLLYNVDDDGQAHRFVDVESLDPEEYFRASKSLSAQDADRAFARETKYSRPSASDLPLPTTPPLPRAQHAIERTKPPSKRKRNRPRRSGREAKFYKNYAELPQTVFADGIKLASNVRYSTSLRENKIMLSNPVDEKLFKVIAITSRKVNKTTTRPPKHFARMFPGLRKPPGTSASVTIAINENAKRRIKNSVRSPPPAGALDAALEHHSLLYPVSVPFDKFFEKRLDGKFKRNLAKRVCHILGTHQETSGDIALDGTTNYPFCGTNLAMKNSDVVSSHKQAFVYEFVSWFTMFAAVPYDTMSGMTPLELLQSGLIFPTLFTVKNELHTARKYNTGRYRVISATGLVMQVLEQLLLGPLITMHKVNRTSIPSECGTGWVSDEQLEDFLDRIRGDVDSIDGKAILSSNDVSGWDWSVPIWLHTALKDSWKRQLSIPPTSVYSSLIDKLHLITILQPVFCDDFGRIITPCDDYLGFQLSGRKVTTFGNSEMRALLCFVVSAIAESPFSIPHTNGDDCLESLPRPKDLMSWRTKIDRTYNSLGFRLRDQRLESSDFGFCSTEYSLENDLFPYTQNPRKITAAYCYKILSGISVPGDTDSEDYAFNMRHHPERLAHSALVDQAFDLMGLVNEEPWEFDPSDPFYL
jgi:hypothetical protein